MPSVLPVPPDVLRQRGGEGGAEGEQEEEGGKVSNFCYFFGWEMTVDTIWIQFSGRSTRRRGRPRKRRRKRTRSRVEGNDIYYLYIELSIESFWKRCLHEFSVFAQ